MNMTKREYAEAIAERIGGEVKETQKGMTTTIGVTRQPENGQMAPVIYIEPFYNNDMPLDDAEREVRTLMVTHAKDEVDVAWIREYDKVKDKLKARLYNKVLDVDVYRSAEEYGFDDLIIVPYIDDVISGVDNKGSVRVNKSLISSWGVSEDEVIDIALENAKKEVKVQPLHEMLGMPAMPPLMMVVTSNSLSCGAISILFVKEKLKELFPNGWTVIPSSIHEVLVTELAEADKVDSMVVEVNDTQVDPTEQLSNHGYAFAA